MNSLRGFLLFSILIFLSSCASIKQEPEISLVNEPVLVEEFDNTSFEYPQAVKVLSENAIIVPLPDTDLLTTEELLSTLDSTSDFPGVHMVSRHFTEQLINTLLSYGHITTIEYVTDVFIYMQLECDNYTYLIWWSNNQLMLTGDFVIVREFLR